MSNVLTKMYTYEFDIYKKELVSDCNFYPTEVNQNDTPWLWARNNKYPYGSFDQTKIGKWMLFSPKNEVNAIWDKIKLAVKNGELWTSKVSTTNNYASHAFMIYTKDYTDLNDVIKVHDYLESSGIKLPDKIIYYKTDQQTHAGIYTGGTEKPWIYSSYTIREEAHTNTHTYEYDLYKKELVSDCNFYPTEVNQNDTPTPWLWARNNKYPYGSFDQAKIGKWMLFSPKNEVNVIWDKIKMAVKSGELWTSKVSTTNSYDSHAFMIYTKDYTDLNDVIKVHDYLESSGIKLPDKIIYYKTDQQTHAGIYSGGKEKPWIYSTYTIREEALTDTHTNSNS